MRKDTQRRYVWGTSGSGLSDYAWDYSEREASAWVGNDAAAHITLLRSTVEQELAFGMEQLGVPREEMFSRIRQVAQQWGLTPLLQRDPSALSTGQTRRVAIASALLTNPDALVLDCPLDGCDADAEATLAAVIEHFPGDVTICDRRWTQLAAQCQSFRYENGALVAQDPPRPQLPAGDYAALEAAGGEAPGETQPGETQPGGLRIHNLRVRREDAAQAQTFELGPLSVHFPAGKITHLRGPNGCGKTTLMLAMAALIPAEGTVDAPVIGWVPTAMDQAFSQRSAVREVSLGSDRAHARAALRWCGLGDVTETHPLDLPSSKRRLLAFACAIVRGPGVLLLDEPTVGLDTAGIEQLAELMQRFVRGEWHAYLREQGLAALHEGAPTLVWSCHEQDFARISDHVVDLPLQ